MESTPDSGIIAWKRSSIVESMVTQMVNPAQTTWLVDSLGILSGNLSNSRGFRRFMARSDGTTGNFGEKSSLSQIGCADGGMPGEVASSRPSAVWGTGEGGYAKLDARAVGRASDAWHGLQFHAGAAA